MATKQLIEELTYQRDLWKADCLKLEAEVRILEETIATLSREQAVLKDEDNRLLHEVDRLTAIADAAEANLQETIHTHAEFVSLRLEVERLRAGMDFYANPVNWWWDSERNSWIWMGDNHPDMTACRALAGEEQ